jgi:hypothetical protein
VEELWETPLEDPSFSVVWRGYSRRQVDEYVRALKSSGTPSTNTDADAQLAKLFASEPVAMFDVVLRGYDRSEVDEYIGRFDR